MTQARAGLSSVIGLLHGGTRTRNPTGPGRVRKPAEQAYGIRRGTEELRRMAIRSGNGVVQPQGPINRAALPQCEGDCKESAADRLLIFANKWVTA
ncbi:protein of unknown function [Cupriavidus taiwanensis]|nr:protein of unknown function [Cupriavidus taiwanensis]